MASTLVAMASLLNKVHAKHDSHPFNKKLLGTSATLVVTGALLVVTMFAIILF